MIWKENGEIKLTETDLAVLRSTAIADLPRGDPGVWQRVDLRLPPVHAPVLFTLMTACPPAVEGFWIAHRTVLDCSNHPEKYYVEYEIKTGDRSRPIASPRYPLLFLQDWIRRNILDRIKPSPNACAYVKGATLRDHASHHQGKALMVKLDVRHFFDSVSYDMVYRVFNRLAGYETAGATLLTHLCCLRGRLPQGAPTSPALSNLCMIEPDAAIESYCCSRGITYTRYSDDMIFSADQLDAAALIAFVRDTLKGYGLSLNADKTRILGKGARHLVTGVVCNEKLSVPAAYRRRIRQEMHYLQKYGAEDHLRRLQDPRFVFPEGTLDCRGYLNSLRGRIAFVLQISPGDREFMEYARRLKEPGDPDIFLDPNDGDELPF